LDHYYLYTIEISHNCRSVHPKESYFSEYSRIEQIHSSSNLIIGVYEYLHEAYFI